MRVELKGFIGLLRDNDNQYISSLKKILENQDPWAGAEIVKSNSELNFRICLSDASKFDSTLQNINNFNNLFGIQVQYAKSMKRTATIQFSLSI